MKHGGKRSGAGRPPGSGKYNESTKTVRIPKSLINRVRNYIDTRGNKFPLYSNKISAGFPSPADDHIEKQLDLNEHLIKNPSSTFFLRVSGESMKNAGIFPNDILIVDRSLKPIDGKIVIAALDGELTVKRLRREKNILYLMPENPDYQPIKINEAQDLIIWGVVTNVIHTF